MDNILAKVVQQPSTVYGIGPIIALIYFIANATKFLDGCFGNIGEL
ncbi:MAG: hypothetical protein IPL12_07985 [Bacteroidetes bacterium]|nr:hypothetical protein [Bacteroidota bacterium]